MSKNKKQAYAILAAIFIVFTVCVFAVPFPKRAAFWIGYIFEVIAIGLQIPVFKLAFDNRDELKSKVLGFPVFRVGYIYLGVQTAASLLLFILGGVIENFPAWIAVVVCVLILGAAFICSMAADIARDEVERIEYAAKKDTSFMTKLRSDSAALVSMADGSVKKELEKLAENIRFSDPVSSEAIAADEKALMAKFGELSEAVNSGAENVTSLINEVTKLLNARNAKCKANK